MRCVVQMGNPEQAPRPTRWGPLIHTPNKRTKITQYILYTHLKYTVKYIKNKIKIVKSTRGSKYTVKT